MTSQLVASLITSFSIYPVKYVNVGLLTEELTPLVDAAFAKAAGRETELLAELYGDVLDVFEPELSLIVNILSGVNPMLLDDTKQKLNRALMSSRKGEHLDEVEKMVLTTVCGGVWDYDA